LEARKEKARFEMLFRMIKLNRGYEQDRLTSLQDFNDFIDYGSQNDDQ